MFAKKTEPTITVPEVREAAMELKRQAREIEAETRNVLDVCRSARSVDNKILDVSQQLARASTTADMLKLSQQLAALCQQRSAMDAKIDGIAGVGGLMGRKIEALADNTLARLEGALKKLAAINELERR